MIVKGLIVMRNGRLKISVGKHSGFCFGVRRAYDLARVNSKNCSNLYILGKLVHNNDVCEDLRKKGIREVKSLDKIKEGTIIFTAHGIGPKLYESANAKGIKIIDTTCPKVMKAQRLAKSYAEKGWQVIIFGDKEHKEVKGIKEWSKNKAKIIGSLAEAKKLKLNKKKKYCLISQTTQNVSEFKKIKDYLACELDNSRIRSKSKPIGAHKPNNFVCFNTICDSTDNRQAEVRKLAKVNDAVIVIGGRMSANSRRLFEIAKSINSRSYFIENARQLKKNWLRGIKKIAITAGASTPEWVIEDTVSKIRKFVRS